MNKKNLLIFGISFIVLSLISLFFVSAEIKGSNFELTEIFNFNNYTNFYSGLLKIVIFLALSLIFAGIGLYNFFFYNKKIFYIVSVGFAFIGSLILTKGIFMISNFVAILIALLLFKPKEIKLREVLKFGKHYLFIVSLIITIFVFLQVNDDSQVFKDELLNMSLSSLDVEELMGDSQNQVQSILLQNEEIFVDLYMSGYTQGLQESGINLNQEQEETIRNTISPQIHDQLVNSGSEEEISSGDIEEEMNKMLEENPIMETISKIMPLIVALTVFGFLKLMFFFTKILLFLLGLIIFPINKKFCFKKEHNNESNTKENTDDEIYTQDNENND